MPAVIELKNITKTYRLGGETLNALDNVNLTIQSGDFVAITGPSGSGKSTLANIIGGLDKPTSGSVIIDGNDLAHLHDAKLSAYRNKHIGFVFQSFNLQGSNTALGFLGGIIGLGIGYILILIANPIINKQLQVNSIKTTNIINLPPWLILSVIAVTTVIGTLAGLYPARRAAKLDPVEALHYE